MRMPPHRTDKCRAYPKRREGVESSRARLAALVVTLSAAKGVGCGGIGRPGFFAPLRMTVDWAQNDRGSPRGHGRALGGRGGRTTWVRGGGCATVGGGDRQAGLVR